MLLLTFLALLIAQSHATTLKVWTWTVWDFGGHVENGFEKIVQIIQQSGADVFALQQANGKPLTDFQAALGPDWNLAHKYTILVLKYSIL